MNFNAEQLRKITFPTVSLAGYKKQDVDDFLTHAANDYDAMKETNTELEKRLTLAENQKESLVKVFEKEKSDYLAEIKELNAKLNEASKDERDVHAKKRSFENALIIAQDAALKIEENAELEARRLVGEARTEQENILKEAKVEGNSIKAEAYNLLAEANGKVSEANSYYEEQMTKLESEKEKRTKEIMQLESEANNVRLQIISEYQRAINNLSEGKWQNWINTVKKTVSDGIE